MIYYRAVNTARGWVGLAGRGGRLVRSTLPQTTKVEAVQAVLAGLGGAMREDERAFGEAPERMRRYFAGERVSFDDVDLCLDGYGPFHSAALLAARRIPYGEVVTYRDLARMAGSERAARAAGGAMARNDFPIIVPCHRVVASGGGLGGFSSGLEWKIELLRLEGARL